MLYLKNRNLDLKGNQFFYFLGVFILIFCIASLLRLGCLRSQKTISSLLCFCIIVESCHIINLIRFILRFYLFLVKDIFSDLKVWNCLFIWKLLLQGLLLNFENYLCSVQWFALPSLSSQDKTQFGLCMFGLESHRAWILKLGQKLGRAFALAWDTQMGLVYLIMMMILYI